MSSDDGGLGNSERTIGGQTTAQRRRRRDAVDIYDRDKLLRNVAQAKKVAEAKEKKEEDDREARKNQSKGLDDLNAPIWKVWGLLKPTWKTAFGSESEAMGMIAICVIRIFEFRMQTDVVRALEGTLNSRNMADFKAGLLRSTMVSLGGALLSIVYNYLQSRLNHKWRVKLTDLLHEKYFKNMNYYYIGAGGGRG
eukprot:COSAG05_NODE_3501_length_2025_cov_10.964174_2_plen_194_part_01